jgi:ABC-type histidine transport system ATPase subunit
LELKIKRVRRSDGNSEREKEKLKKARGRLTDEVRQQQVAIWQHESNLKAVMDQKVELRGPQEKNNEPSEKFINEWKMSVV